jgi:hypothetical protein
MPLEKWPRRELVTRRDHLWETLKPHRYVQLLVDHMRDRLASCSILLTVLIFNAPDRVSRLKPSPSTPTNFQSPIQASSRAAGSPMLDTLTGIHASKFKQ